MGVFHGQVFVHGTLGGIIHQKMSVLRLYRHKSMLNLHLSKVVRMTASGYINPKGAIHNLWPKKKKKKM